MRKSRWSSGNLPSKKKQVKKKILGSDTEDKEEKDQDEEDDKNEDETMEVEKPPSPGPSHMSDLTPSSPRPIREANAITVNSNEDLVAPSIPTGIRIDSNKITQWMNDLIRFTDSFNVEKLERIYTSMSKVIRKYRKHTDRTGLPADLQAELEIIKSQERELGQRQHDNEYARQRR